MRRLFRWFMERIFKGMHRKCDPVGVANVNFSVLGHYSMTDTEDLERLKELKRQRLERGFDETETWDLYTTIAMFILPRLVEFRKLSNGFGQDFSSMEEWLETVDKMILGFRKIVEWNNPEYHVEVYRDRKNLKATYMEDLKLMEEGLALFAKYFQELWW